MEFDSQLHETLFTCFILKANSSDSYEEEMESIELNFGIYANLCIRDYWLSWEDRSYCEEEYGT
jgi:hypothetical protein